MRQIFAFLFLTLTTFLNGQIVELSSFQDLSSHLTSDTLLILDIDDTLLIPKQMLGCDEWFCYRINQKKLAGSSSIVALEKTLAEWEAIRHLSQMELVENATAAIIQSLQSQGYPIFGLTTQGLALATRTAQQLMENQIDLTLTAPSQEDLYFPLKEHGVLFRKGILFTSGTQKGEALFQFCKKLHYPVARIVFVNDKETHLAEVAEMASRESIEFLGLRYSHCDARKAAFNPEIAEVQFHHSNFDQILSDKQAELLLKTNHCHF